MESGWNERRNDCSVNIKYSRNVLLHEQISVHAYYWSEIEIEGR